MFVSSVDDDRLTNMDTQDARWRRRTYGCFAVLQQLEFLVKRKQELHGVGVVIPERNTNGVNFAGNIQDFRLQLGEC